MCLFRFLVAAAVEFLAALAELHNACIAVDDSHTLVASFGCPDYFLVRYDGSGAVCSALRVVDDNLELPVFEIANQCRGFIRACRRAGSKQQAGNKKNGWTFACGHHCQGYRLIAG